MVDEGLDEPPSYTALARKTHTGKDGSFLEELVLEIEEAVEEMLQDGSPLGDSQTDSTAASNAKRYLLNQEYIKVISSLILILFISAYWLSKLIIEIETVLVNYWNWDCLC